MIKKREILGGPGEWWSRGEVVPRRAVQGKGGPRVRRSSGDPRKGGPGEHDQTKTLKPTPTRETPHHETVKPTPTDTHTQHHKSKSALSLLDSKVMTNCTDDWIKTLIRTDLILLKLIRQTPTNRSEGNALFSLNHTICSQEYWCRVVQN